MGTRSITHVKDADGQTLISLYGQWDGDPSGVGADIKEALGTKQLVNGIRVGDDDERQIMNGMGDAAAQLVAALKDGAGSFYIFPPDSPDQQWTYTLWPDGDWAAIDARIARLMLTVRSRYHGELYSGPLSEFDPGGAERQAASADPA